MTITLDIDDQINVTNSFGCRFCDAGLFRYQFQGLPAHSVLDEFQRVAIVICVRDAKLGG